MCLAKGAKEPLFYFFFHQVLLDSYGQEQYVPQTLLESMVVSHWINVHWRVTLMLKGT